MARWSYTTLGEVCTIERGGSPRPIDKYITDDPNGINWIKIGDTSDSMYITSTKQKIIPDGMKKSRFVKAGDFLLSNSMSFGRPYILKIDGCIHDGWLVIRDEANVFDKRFLYYYLSAPSTYEKFKNMAVGGVVNNLNSEMVRKTSVPLPPLEEQRKIAAVLDKIDSLISKHRQQLEKLDLLVKSQFVEMFGTWHSPKYGVKTVEELCEFVKDGTHQTPTYTDDTNGGYKFLSSKDVTSKYIDWSNIKYIPAELHEQLYAHIAPQKGDILLAKNGTTGVCAVVDTDEIFDIYVSLALLRPKAVCRAKYLWAAINMPETKEQFDLHLKGIGVPNLHLGEIKKTKIVLPPEDKQDEFVNLIQQAEQSKFAINQSLEKLETLKKALMQDYFE